MKKRLAGWLIFVAILVGASVAYIRARQERPVTVCVQTLGFIDGAKQQWAMDTKTNGNAMPAWSNIVLYLIREPKCPQGGAYTLGRVMDSPTCSYPGHKLRGTE